MRHKQGFSLIEAICYVALSAILSSLLFRFVAKNHIDLTGNTKQCQLFIVANNACDSFARDIFQAPANIKKWKEMKDNFLVWRAKDVDIGFYMKDKKLIRVSGNYNISTNKWSKASRSCIFGSLDALRFEYKINPAGDCITSVEICINYEKESIVRNVFLKNEV
ncbi:hypothetical protein HN446_03885 [bacterium]|jgi:hypothetical protein|nr:hypothetical protein [bacterium]